jgi:hypothetical protein
MMARNAARVLCSNDKGLRRPYCCGTFSESLVGSLAPHTNRDCWSAYCLGTASAFL